MDLKNKIFFQTLKRLINYNFLPNKVEFYSRGRCVGVLCLNYVPIC